jgi:cytidine deaminase
MRELLAAALEARDRAYAPYSKFAVGAAIEDTDGRIFSGCNVENASYGLTVCAERNAVFRAIADGARRFRRIAVVAGASSLTPPCGACRQVLWELCGDVEVILFNLSGERASIPLRELLPKAFDATLLSDSAQ